MPYSSNVFNKKVLEVVKKINPRTCLDIGSGAGKYGELIKDVIPQANMVGIEIEKDYIKKFDLAKKYNEILNISAIDLINPSYYDVRFDLVFVGDVLEHLKKSDGIDLLNFLTYRSKFILIIFPHKYLQNAVNGYVSEAHISVWDKSDFQCFDATKILSKGTQRLVLIKGYLENSMTIKDLNQILSE